MTTMTRTAPVGGMAISGQTQKSVGGGYRALPSIDRGDWARLSRNAVEPNAFFDAGFSLPVNRLSDKKRANGALCATGAEDELIGLLPASWAMDAVGVPVPVLIANQPYSPLGTPLLDRADPVAAASGLIAAAREAGARAIEIPMMSLNGPAFAALAAALEQEGMAPRAINIHERAAFQTAPDADAYLRAGLGAKRLKDLRRLRHRLDELGHVTETVASDPGDLAAALDRFLALEAKGWKGARGTGLGQSAGDRAFAHAAATELGRTGHFDILELCLDGVAIASGLVLKSGDRAFFFKIAYDEAFAKYSVGVQLTIALTHRLGADTALRYADSTALPGHPMIDHVWRERLRIGDVTIPTRPGALTALSTRLLVVRNDLRGAAKAMLNSLKATRTK